FSAMMWRLAQRLGRRWFFAVALYAILFVLVTTALGLPLAFYEGYIREHAYGLSNQTLGKWVGDTLKTVLISCAAAALLLWIPYSIVRKSPRRWWLYTSLAAVPLFMLFLLIGPLWIAPLFNHFGPMKDKALEARI